VIITQNLQITRIARKFGYLNVMQVLKNGSDFVLEVSSSSSRRHIALSGTVSGLPLHVSGKWHYDYKLCAIKITKISSLKKMNKIYSNDPELVVRRNEQNV
jgi:hypothetical protein